VNDTTTTPIPKSGGTTHCSTVEENDQGGQLAEVG